MNSARTAAISAAIRKVAMLAECEVDEALLRAEVVNRIDETFAAIDIVEVVGTVLENNGVKDDARTVIALMSAQSRENLVASVYKLVGETVAKELITYPNAVVAKQRTLH